MAHPMERRSYSRRDFLRRAAAAGIAVPSLSAILAACRDSTSGTPGGTGAEPEGPAGIELASPSNPVELPLSEDVPAIADGLSPEAGPLRVYNWNDYIYKKVLKSFQAKYDVEIEYTQFTGMSEAITKIQNGTVDWDLFFPTIENLPKLVAAKQVQPLNHTYIPNMANIWPVLADPWYDVGSRYSTPYLTWKTGIGYRADHVDEPSNYDMPFDIFWDPQWKGKAGVLDEYRETIGMALLRNGGNDFNSHDAAEVTAAVDSLTELIDLVDIEIGPGDYEKIAKGTQWVRYSWSGNMNYARWYLEDQPVDVLGFYFPEGANWEVANDLIVVNSQSQNPVLAHLMIDHLMDIDEGLTNFGYEGFQPPFQGVDEATFREAGYIPDNLANTLVTEQDFQTGSPVLALPPEVDQIWQDEWARFKAGVA